MRLALFAAALFLLGQPVLAASRNANNFHATVLATANIFAAGSGGVKANGGGTAPTKIAIPAGAKSVQVFQVTGRISCGGGCGSNDANGGPPFNTNIQSSGGISGIIGPGNMFLVGVFVGFTTPNPPGPKRLNVTRMRQMLSVAPQLNQTFFVGTGRIGRFVRQITIPRGAKFFDLGFADGNGVTGPPGFYSDNTGTLDVRCRFF